MRTRFCALPSIHVSVQRVLKQRYCSLMWYDGHVVTDGRHPYKRHNHEAPCCTLHRCSPYCVVTGSDVRQHVLSPAGTSIHMQAMHLQLWAQSSREWLRICYPQHAPGEYFTAGYHVCSMAGIHDCDQPVQLLYRTAMSSGFLCDMHRQADNKF